MTQRDNLYRRSSGIYVLRITVPARYRAQVRQQEIHVSTKTTNLKAAKAVASHLLVQWHLCMRELDQVNEAKVIQGSPLLTGPGAISIQVFCDTFDVEAELVFQEILNNNIDIACLLRAQRIHWVDDYTKVDRETDTGGFVLDSALELGREQVFTGYLQPFHRGHTIANMIEHRYSLETVFRSKRKTLNAAFCDLPGIQISASTIFITKIQAERIRAPWVKILIANSALSAQASAQILIPTLTPIQPPAPKLLPTVSPPTAVGISPVTAVPLVFEARFCNPKYSEMRSSNLLEKFFEYKAPQWKPGHHERVATICGSFIDLMGDPLLGVIDRDLIRKYEAKLRKMPSNRYEAARRHGTNDANELLYLAESLDEERLSEKSIVNYLNKLKELFSWAVDEDYLTKNPAVKIVPKVLAIQKRAQDARDKFEQCDLLSIFSVEWFKLGGITRNKSGGLRETRPYYYWLPLLGLYTGARLNEICQLYLEDIEEYEPGKYLIFINDHDPATAHDKNPTFAIDKSIKNKASKRSIPIHPDLVFLGLIDYIHALKANGYTRLFPELRFDRIKGYARAAGSWFNERFLGKTLKFERNGMKTFHSFRHTFITALIDNAIPENIINEIAGHERGDTTSLNRYGKDAAARQCPHLEKLNFNLPAIHPFKVHEGLASIKHALRRRVSPAKS